MGTVLTILGLVVSLGTLGAWAYMQFAAVKKGAPPPPAEPTDPKLPGV
jgi:hypothetical protein